MGGRNFFFNSPPLSNFLPPVPERTTIWESISPRHLKAGRFPMPVYDYLCNDCGKEFEKVLSLTEHDHDRMTCPHCGSENVEQEAKAFFAVTSKKS
jgi:putative FmdB family regulatory protein